VRSAEVIGAADVFSNAPSAPEPAGGDATPGEPGVVRPRSFSLTGADLAIVRDPARLLGGGTGALGGAWLPAGLYGGGLLALALAFLDRRRREVDPARLRLRRLADEVRRELDGAASLPAADAASVLARSLRRLHAERPWVHPAGLDAFLGECDARSYAPESQRAAGSLSDDFFARARALVDELVEEPS
jgi:hypothetical protein